MVFEENQLLGETTASKLSAQTGCMPFEDVRKKTTLLHLPYLPNVWDKCACAQQVGWDKHTWEFGVLGNCACNRAGRHLHMAAFIFCVSLDKNDQVCQVSHGVSCAKGLHGFWAAQRGGTGDHAALLQAQLAQPAISSEVAPENVLKGHKLNLPPRLKTLHKPWAELPHHTRQ